MKNKDYKLQTRVELGKPLLLLGTKDGKTVGSLKIKLWRNNLYNLCKIENKDIGEDLVSYSFFHRYAKQYYAEKIPFS